MAAGSVPIPSKRVLIVMPTWLGDCVMATPTLRAVRELYPVAHVAALVGSAQAPILDALPWVDELLTAEPGERPWAVAGRLRAQRFDLAVLLPNSFRSALVARLAGIPRRLGYDREGRGWLLTDRLLPRRRAGGGFVKVPTLDYYLGLAMYLGADRPSGAMALFTREADDAAADDLLRQGGYDPADGGRLVLLNPGANFGDAKRWPAERFAAVAGLAANELGAQVAVSGAPKERAILDELIAAADVPVIDLPRLGMSLRLLKSVVKRASLMVTNDTGPRHVAAALGTPVVTIFGPTDPAWTHIPFKDERQVQVRVPCGPCQQKRCPLTGTPEELVCMRRITPDMVLAAARELWSPSEARA